MAGAIGLAMLGGCAITPQAAIPLAPEVVGASTRIGVAMSPMPKVNTSFPGANCLLCMAAAEIANTSLTKHTQQLPSADLQQLKTDAVQALAAHGAQTKAIAEPLDVAKLPAAKSKGPNIARKDFSSLSSRYQIDKLVVIELTSVGFTRPYASYVPTSDPKAAVTGAVYLINLSNNTYEWYAPLNLQRAADGKWDEAPDFPGLTNAYYQVIEATRDGVLKPLNDTSSSGGATPAVARP
jgi:hypothetical protein